MLAGRLGLGSHFCGLSGRHDGASSRLYPAQWSIVPVGDEGRAPGVRRGGGNEVSAVGGECWLLLFDIRKIRPGGCGWRGRDGWAGWLIG